MRSLATIVLALLVAACSSARTPEGHPATRAGLQALLADPDDLPPYLVADSEEPSTAELILTQHYPAAVGASLLLATAPTGRSGCVTVVAFPDASTAAEAIRSWQSLLHVFGNVVELELSISALGEEAFGSFIRPSNCLPPVPGCFIPQIRLLARRGAVLIAIEYPVVADAAATYSETLAEALRHARRVDSRLHAPGR